MPSRSSYALVLSMLLLGPAIAVATPDRGWNCVNCHGSSQSDGYNDSRLTLLSPTGTINPAERAGATDRGTLPFFQLLPGASRLISVQTNNTLSPNDGFFTNNYQKLGVVNGNTPGITPDSAWTQYPHSAGVYWSKPSYSSGTTYSFNLTVPSTVLPDFYEMEIGWAGNGGNDAGLRRFYVQVLAALPGQWASTGGGNWTSATNWTSLVPNAIGATANFSSAIASDSTVTTDGAITVGSINFDNARRYTIGGSNVLTLDVASGNAAVNVVNGSHTISAPLAVNDNLNIAISPAGSSLSVISSINASSAVALNKSGNGTLVLTAAPNFGAAVNVNGGAVSTEAGSIGTLAISNGARADILAGGHKALRVSGVSLTGTAVLNVNDNGLVVVNGSLPAVQAALTTGYAAGAWNGPGIDSAAAASSAGRFALGSATAEDAIGITGLQTAGFLGVTVSPTDIIARYTLYGDANLDGSVTLADFTRLASKFGLASTWTGGDFNYDGSTTLADFTALAANFGQSVPSDIATINAVPEPVAGIAMVALLLSGSILRRRV